MIILDVIYIGLPFFFWQEDESEHGLDVHVTEGFQKLGFHVYPLNAGDDAEEICSAYNWHTSFVDEDEDITPSEEFISEHVLWDDFRLLYISAAAATSEDEYTQFVCHTAEFAKEFAESEFEKYRIVQDRLFSSDFDRFNNGDNLLSFDINPDKE